MTNDVDRRVQEHNSAENTDSYTSNRRPVKLLWNVQLTDFNQAEELEKQIKGWSRKKKKALIKEQWGILKVLATCRKSQIAQPYYKDLQAFLQSRKEDGAIIYPPQNEIFNAFELTPLDKIKVVILGQDPYPNEGEAHGLCFSVKEGKRIPASLTRIFKELNTDLGLPIPRSGNLTPWAKKGVFLLNTILTVEHKKAGAHRGKGWEEFTDAAIAYISQNCDKVVFMLWGSFAHKKVNLIDEKKHKILKATHPVAMVKNGFYGTKPFSKANAFLDTKVDWSL